MGRLPGNTPTGVGKTWLRRHELTLKEKHPHGRGEDLNFAEYRLYPAETPPRAWGRLGRPRILSPPGGNTPTGVGKTPRI